MRKIVIILSIFTICFQNVVAQFYIVQDTDGYVNVRGEHNKIIDKISTGTIVWESVSYGEWGISNSLYVGYPKDDKLYFGEIHLSRLKDISTFTEVHKHENIINLLPKSSYNKLISFPSSSLNWKVYFDETTQSYYITHGGGDGGESYIVLWVIKNGEYEGRHICANVPDHLLHLIPKGILLKNAFPYVEETDGFEGFEQTILPDESVMIDTIKRAKLQQIVDKINTMQLKCDTPNDSRRIYFDELGRLRKYVWEEDNEMEDILMLAYYNENGELVYVYFNAGNNYANSEETFYVHNGKIIDFVWKYSCGCCEDDEEVYVNSKRPVIGTPLTKSIQWDWYLGNFTYADTLLKIRQSNEHSEFDNYNE